VPAIAVSPDVAFTVNLFVLTSKFPSTPAAPVTLNIPAIAVSPDVAFTVNLFVLTAKLSVTSSVPVIVALLVTLKSLLIYASFVTVKSFAMVTSVVNPTVNVWLLAVVIISFIVPAI